MVDMYVRLVKDGKRNIEQVPVQYREQVKTIIEGEITNG